MSDISEVRRRALRVLHGIGLADAIIVASVHHTGTVTMLDLLGGHPETGEVFEFRDLLKGADVVQNDVVHIHVYGGKLESRGVVKGLHFGDLASMAQKGWARIVVPVRDPMLALISRQARQPTLDHSFIIRGFESIARFPESVLFFPVDLDSGENARVARVANLFLDLGLSRDLSDLAYEQIWAEEWPVKNTAGPHPLKDMYAAGQMFELRNNMPEEFDLLVEKAPGIVPFLNRMGYGPMAWWSTGS